MIQTTPSLLSSSRAPSFVADLSDAQPTGPFEFKEEEALVFQQEVEIKKEQEELMTGLHARFVEDITVQDGASFPAGALFVKTWKLKK